MSTPLLGENDSTNHSDASSRRRLSCFSQGRCQKLCEKATGEKIGPELRLVILLDFQSSRRNLTPVLFHNRYIFQPGFSGKNLLGRLFDCRQVIEVEMKGDQLVFGF